MLRDMRGAPVAGAAVAYHYEGRTFALVEALSYDASPLALLQSDASGRVVVPGAVHVHWPLIQTHPAVMIDLIYAPTLHNGLASIRGGAVSRPRQFEVAADRATVRLEDVSDDPELWLGTLMNLGSLLGELTSRASADERTSRLIGQLAADFAREYQSILDRHGDTRRPRPGMPPTLQYATEQEKQAWGAMVEKDLTERPMWADELERRFSGEVAYYSRFAVGR